MKNNINNYVNSNFIIQMILFFVLSVIAVIILSYFKETSVIQKSLFGLVIFFIIIFYFGKVLDIFNYFINSFLKLNFWEGQALIISMIVLFFSIFYFFPNIISLNVTNIGRIFLIFTLLIILYPFIKKILKNEISIVGILKKINAITVAGATIYLLRELMNNETLSSFYIFLAGMGFAGFVVYLTNKFNLIEELGPFAFGIYSIFATFWATYFIPDFTTFAFSTFLSRGILNFMNNFVILFLINICIIANFLFYVQDPFTILKVFIILFTMALFVFGMAVYWAPILCTEIDFIEEETGWSNTKIIGVILFIFSLFLVKNIYRTIQYAKVNKSGAPTLWSSPLSMSDIFYALIIYGILFLTTELTYEKIDIKKNLAESFWLRTAYSILILFVGSMLDYKIKYSQKDKIQILVERGIVWLIVITFFLYSIFKMGYLETISEIDEGVLNNLKNPGI